MSEKNCEHCHERPSTIRIVQQLGDKVTKHSFCETCAEKLGITGDGMNFSLANLLTAFANLDSVTEAAAEPETACACGLTFPEFRESGRLGCAQCYTTFAPRLAQLLRTIHGSTEHRGKCPRRRAAAVSRNRERLRLQADLRDAVRREDYETAARLRDTIRGLAPDEAPEERA